jgi:hypothetical protein
MSGSLGSQVAAALAAMDFPNGNDAPNSSGCPNGTGTAPMPCAMPGEAGCLPSSGFPTPEESYARYTTPVELTLDLPAPPGTIKERSPEYGDAEWEYDSLLMELTAEANAFAVDQEVWEIRNDPVKRVAFAEALWVPFYERYQMENLRLGVDLLMQGTLGVLAVLAPGAAALEGGIVTLYHGTTRSAASRILANGFRAGSDGAVFFAEDFATAEHFASVISRERGAAATVLRLRVPSNVASQLQRGVIGEFRGLRFVDLPGGTGFEQILLGESLGGFNAALKSGSIQVGRIPIGGM